MSVFDAALRNLPAVISAAADLERHNTPVMLTGPGHIHKILLTHALCAKTASRALFVVSDEAEATRVCEDLQALGMDALFLPSRELALHHVESSSREYEQMRLAVLTRMAQGHWSAVVACAEAVTAYTLPPDTLLKRTLHITAGQSLPVTRMTTVLTAAGYERCDQIEGPGQFAVRGGIVDVYAAQNASPLRIELWGDTVDTLSYFDVLSQRRTESLTEADIPPACEIMYEQPETLASAIEQLASSLTGKHAAAVKDSLSQDADQLRGGAHLSSVDKYLSLIYPQAATALDYIGDALVVVSESTKVREHLKAADWQLQEDIRSLLEEGLLCKELCRYRCDWDTFAGELEARHTVLMETFAHSSVGIDIRSLYTVPCRQLPVWSGGLDLLCDDLRDALARKNACLILAGHEERNAQALADDLCKRDLPALYAPAPDKPVKGQVLILRGGLSAGAEFPDIGLTLITHGRIAAVRQHRRSRKRSGDVIHNLSELTPGDYVVHTAHGIGVYEGIRQLDVQGVTKDYITLRYDKGDRLYVPVTQLDLVSKYIGTGEDVQVHLHRLGGQEWQKTKSRVRAAVKDIAKELIQLYSRRMATPGFAFEPDAEWQYDFERHFEFEETEDQLRCIDEIKSDMERPVPMDRLLCGDVGFGKTEVALRAAFKCVSQSKQCVLLVPTTILALQHYNTILKRFDGFPVKAEMLCRFRTPKQQERILRDMAAGNIDILIGTHRMLSKDVKFRNLGLFIVDEEQRFGVAQKERIKELAPNVDVLTLSATPIPRTLNMAMSGIRDMSIIEEAPQDRRPVQTYVLEHDNSILDDAIRRELRRGGQIYYIHNRVDNIERCAAGIQMRLPESRVVFAHGKMTEDELSEVWRQIIDHEADILVCTTIIETGVDVPNVNTLIIENADRFGLSQLHQLRGRVGRSSRRAFAYLTFVRGKVLTDIAEKRLEAIREFTEFGAGFKIAMRDMEIRGAGNLLGAQQHGHMEAVGYDMYLRLLADAVDEEKNGAKAPSDEAECLIDLPVSAHIPETYIAANTQRLDIYRRIADIRTEEDSYDVYDELIDRFGEPPEAVQGLIDVALLRNMAAAAGIIEVKQNADTVLLYPHTLDLTQGSRLSSALKRRVMISAGAKPYYAVRIPQGLTSLDVLRETLQILRPEEKTKK